MHKQILRNLSIVHIFMSKVFVAISVKCHKYIVAKRIPVLKALLCSIVYSATKKCLVSV